MGHFGGNPDFSVKVALSQNGHLEQVQKLFQSKGKGLIHYWGRLWTCLGWPFWDNAILSQNEDFSP